MNTEREVDIYGPGYRMALERARKLRKHGIDIRHPMRVIEHSLPGRPSMVTPCIRELIPTPKVP